MGFSDIDIRLQYPSLFGERDSAIIRRANVLRCQRLAARAEREFVRPESAVYRIRKLTRLLQSRKSRPHRQAREQH